MTIGLTDEAHDLRDSVRGWAARHVTPDVLRAAVDAKSDERPSWYGSLVELGVTGLNLPEDLGGAGYGLTETAVVAEELGRALVPGNFVPSAIVATVLHEAGRDDLVPAIVDGSVHGALALDPGTMTLDRAAGTLTGSSGYVIGGQIADLLVIAARDADRVVFVVVRADEVSVTDHDAYDLVRGTAVVVADGLSLDPSAILDLDPQRVRDVAATLFAAEASGVADWAVTTAAEYARVRRQFGRPIGQFQGVKHRAARALVLAEQARAAAWDAARALAEGAGDEASLAAAVAGAVAPEAAFAATKDCIQILGGIGYTWEHDAHLYLRRAQSIRILLGSTASWRRRVADLTLAGVRRDIDVELPPEADAVRADVRADLARAAELDGTERTTYLAEKGYTAPHLPAPWGRGAGAVEQLVIAEELRASDVTPHDMVIGNWVVPSLIAHGSTEQIERFVPRSLRGEIVWCQLFSEPGAGSDLASLSTRATKVDGGWELQGQKVWTSMARQADYGICLARTDASVPKHKGLSYFLVDMRDSAGLDIRPLRELTGDALFNEVFFDSVFVPDDMLVGEPGDGWKLARTTLANERVSLSSGSSLGPGGEALLALAQEHGLDDDQRTMFGKILCDAQTLGLLGLRSTLRSLAGAQPGAESSVSKFLGVEHMQELWETAMDWAGPASLRFDVERLSATRMFLSSRCMSIAGGTTEVQLNIIGERLLGLPRDPEPGK